MKYVLSFCFFTFLSLSCQKDPAKTAFLYGRLIDDCNGKPVTNQTVQFYRNFKEGATFLELDTETKLLEEVVTDEDGFFYFTGMDYTTKSTSSYSNSSVRINKGTYLASGHLGKGEDAEKGESIFVHDIGDVLFNGMTLNVDLRIEANSYDSVKIFSAFYNVNIILSDIQEGYFMGNIPKQKAVIKNFWGDENDLKYNLYLRYEFYKNDKIIKTDFQDSFFDQCATSIEILYEH